MLTLEASDLRHNYRINDLCIHSKVLFTLPRCFGTSPWFTYVMADLLQGASFKLKRVKRESSSSLYEPLLNNAPGKSHQTESPGTVRRKLGYRLVFKPEYVFSTSEKGKNILGVTSSFCIHDVLRHLGPRVHHLSASSHMDSAPPKLCRGWLLGYSLHSTHINVVSQPRLIYIVLSW